MAADTEDFEMISHIPFLTKYKNFPGAPTFLPGKPIWPDLCIASYKVDHTCLAKRYSVCFQICLLPEFFFFLSWQPSTIVWDRHLLAKDIVYVFFCCYCGFGNILAYWSNYRAADAEVNVEDNQLPESSKHSDFSTLTQDVVDLNLTSHSPGYSESMPNEKVEWEHLHLNSHVKGEHSFERENRRMNDNVEEEQPENENVEGNLNMSNNNQNETFHDLNDNIFVAG
ncbi:unnamed protein product [Lactuca saligna]|uniref:Uncharacterized protein n=1 Tax=Lactuca saligna TaxID=75948 RepID=A0AA36EPS0_LACSI|nr:unnamed protein product [Lactuca saligna]